MIQRNDVRQPYPLSAEVQAAISQELPAHLAKMVLFKVNVGAMEQEVCRPRWDWEVEVPELNTSVLLIPADFGGRNENSGVKNGENRLIVLNEVAQSVIESYRGIHSERVSHTNGSRKVPQSLC